MNIKATLTVPSTSNVSNEISSSEFSYRQRVVAELFTQKFGGATVSAPSTGFYTADNGQVVQETVVEVYTFIDESGKEAVLAYAKHLAEKWGQEAILVQFSEVEVHFAS